VSNTDPKSIATECLAAWTRGDFVTARALIHDDIRFVGPLGEREGADAYIEGLKGFARIVESAPQHKAIAEGGDVCIHYDLITPAGALPAVGWYQVRDSKISFVQAFFDARPLASILEGRRK
jgi:hypothetical protein